MIYLSIYFTIGLIFTVITIRFNIFDLEPRKKFGDFFKSSLIVLFWPAFLILCICVKCGDIIDSYKNKKKREKELKKLYKDDKVMLDIIQIKDERNKLF